MKINWGAIAAFVVVFLIVALVGMWGGRGMMDWGGFGLIGLLGMLAMWIIPVSLVVLIVAGIVWLTQAASRPASQPSVATRTCNTCGKPTQADWKSCPYCGTALA